jgi:hypothetical protein
MTFEIPQKITFDPVNVLRLSFDVCSKEIRQSADFGSALKQKKKGD